MKFCVVSDTHNNSEYLKLLIEKLRNKINLVIHLGDDSTDTDMLSENEFKVIKIPGVYEQIYLDPLTQRRLIEDFDGIKFLLTHTPGRHSNDLPAESSPEELSRKVDVVLYGHTHIPKIELKNNVLWMNPGHMKKNDKRGYPATYCIIECYIDKENKKVIDVNIYKLLNDKIYERDKVIL